jgi:uncharacterized protein YkwD
MSRPQIAVSAAVLVVVLLVPASAKAGAGEDFNAYVAPVGACLGDSAVAAPAASEQQTMACLVNWARVKRGLEPLHPSLKLRVAAELKIADELRCNDFSHTPCGAPFLSIFQRSGYLTSSVRLWAVGENLAWGQNDVSSPRAIITAWLNSPPHRANVFDPRWTDIGISYRASASFLGYEGVGLWVNEFGMHA